jgi:hypothetical protein
MAAQAASPAAHSALLTRPALLSHIFKYAAGSGHNDVKLLYVNSAWEDTAINFLIPSTF